MEYCKNREDGRKRLLNELVGNALHTSNIAHNNVCARSDDLNELKKSFFTMENLLKDEIQHDLDSNLLGIYIDEGLVPRGLRLKFEAPFKNDTVFLKKWNDFLHESSIGLLKLLKEKRENLVSNLKDQITVIFKDIEFRSTHPAYESFDKILTSRVTTYEKETLQRKIHKLERDRGDYSSGNIKFWQNKRQGLLNKNNNATSVPAHKFRQPQKAHKPYTHIPPDSHKNASSPFSAYKNRTYTNTLNKQKYKGDKPVQLQQFSSTVVSVLPSNTVKALNLPTTSFGSNTIKHQEGMNLPIHREMKPFTHLPLSSKKRNISEVSSSTSLDDSLYTVFNTPREHKETDSDITDINTPIPVLNFHHKDMTESSFNNCTDGPSTSKCIESFLDLPVTLAVTPTYHVMENPHTIKITNSLQSVGQKRKLSTNEEREEANIEPEEIPKKDDPSPKRNKTVR